MNRLTAKVLFFTVVASFATIKAQAQQVDTIAEKVVVAVAKQKNLSADMKIAAALWAFDLYVSESRLPTAWHSGQALEAIESIISVTGRDLGFTGGDFAVTEAVYKASFLQLKKLRVLEPVLAAEKYSWAYEDLSKAHTGAILSGQIELAKMLDRVVEFAIRYDKTPWVPDWQTAAQPQGHACGQTQVSRMTQR